MGRCVFSTKEMLPLIEHALAATKFNMGYEDMTDEQYAEIGLAPPTNRLKPGPALLFVHDSGVYLMSNGVPREVSDVAYADGCNPHTSDFDDWYNRSKDLVGGDDFVEVIPIDNTWLETCKKCELFELVVTPEEFNCKFVRPKNSVKAS